MHGASLIEQQVRSPSDDLVVSRLFHLSIVVHVPLLIRWILAESYNRSDQPVEFLPLHPAFVEHKYA